MSRFILILIGLAASFPVLANGEALVYEWKDFSGQSQTILIEIPYARLQEGMLLGKDHVSLKSAMKLSHSIAQQVASVQASSGVRVVGSPGHFSFTAGAGGREDGALAASLKEQLAQAFNISELRGYFVLDLEANGVRPDYLEILADNRDIFAVTARALVDHFGKDDPLALVNQLLGMLQQIPYDDMNKDPFPMATPVQMLVERRGDCESKQLFLLGVLRELFPERRLAFVSIPSQNHVLAAMELDTDLGSTLYHKGRPYLILDATGPSRQPAGHVLGYYLNAAPQIWIDIDE